MAVYQKNFKFNNRSNKDFGLYVVTFDPDIGNIDSYLSIESVYSENFNGTMRHDYGAKYKDTVTLYITMVKNNYNDFSRSEVRQVLSWLTGLRKSSWLDLYNDANEISFSFLGRITDVKLQKMDSRIIGVMAEFVSVSPWAYSGIKKYESTINGVTSLHPICNCSDEDSIYIYPKVIFTNKTKNGSLSIYNIRTQEETKLQGLAMNEVVTMDNNKIIYSDNITKIFKDDFNFQWLRFAQGYNHINISGNGHLIIEYREIFKVAEAFDENDYMNIMPPKNNKLLLTNINFIANNWVTEPVSVGDVAKYSQQISVDNITKNSKIDLQPTEEQLLDMQHDNIEIQIINDNGVITAYAYNHAPTKDYVMQATIEEIDKEITHNYDMITLYQNAWYNLGDIYTQPIYLKNITKHSIIDFILTEQQKILLEDNGTTLLCKNNRGKIIAYALGYKPTFDLTIDIQTTETTTNAEMAFELTDIDEPYAEPFYF